MLHTMQHHFLCNISFVVIAPSMGMSLMYTTSTVSIPHVDDDSDTYIEDPKQGRRWGSKSGGGGGGGADIFYGILRAQVYGVGVSPWATRGVWGACSP